ncbi:uncharacterized protein LOC124989122 isoform X2 [Sciurus carolinensis]|uniref:uncharacterized protein LOC124989122 isoform X2 n=1 Tax=Sciurus carolinensis TaxID=30640 RepID=UPI001FB3BCA1|nr:uncharacterized protein LOC124989122 isoform X2 [Sciurus carolinensis]
MESGTALGVGVRSLDVPLSCSGVTSVLGKLPGGPLDQEEVQRPLSPACLQRQPQRTAPHALLTLLGASSSGSWYVLQADPSPRHRPREGPSLLRPSLLLCQPCLRPPRAPAADCRRTSSKLFPRGHIFLPCTLDHRVQLPSLVWPAVGHWTLPARSSRTGAEFVAAGSPAQSARKNVEDGLRLGVWTAVSTSRADAGGAWDLTGLPRDRRAPRAQEEGWLTFRACLAPSPSFTPPPDKIWKGPGIGHVKYSSACPCRGSGEVTEAATRDACGQTSTCTQVPGESWPDPHPHRPPATELHSG